MSWVCVSGYFGPREDLWQEPIDRNVFGLLEQFGDAELAGMVAPRPLIVEVSAGPTATIPGGRGAPARIVSPQVEDVRREAERAKRLFAGSGMSTNLELVISEEGHGPYGTDHALASFLKGIDGDLQLQPSRSDPENLYVAFDPRTRHAQQVHELDRHTQYLLRESHYV